MRHSRVTLRLVPGQTVRITLEPDPPEILSAAEQATLDWVRTAGRVVSRAEVIAALGDDSNPDGFGESTLEHALTRLVRVGHLQKGPGNKGYSAGKKSG